MKAKELLDAGSLAPAIEEASGELRRQPTDLRLRTFLFELLCYAGELGRAERQLDVIDQQKTDAAAQMGVQVYRNLLAAEKKRVLVFSQGLRPQFLLAPPRSVTMHIEALARLRADQAAEARALLDQAAEARSVPRGRAGDAGAAVFDDFRDADDLLAPVLEVFAPSGYCWVPWEHVQFIELTGPQSLRDLLWAPAKLASFDGQLGEVFLPVLYPGSSAHPDDLVRLGRKTDWNDAGAGIMRGVGQKLFLVGDDARTLLELGTIQFEPPAEAGLAPESQ